MKARVLLLLSSKVRLRRHDFKQDFSDNKNYFASDFIRSSILPFYLHSAMKMTSITLWGVRHLMLEADKRRMNLYIKYQSYFILKGIILCPWRDSYPTGSAEMCRGRLDSPQFYTMAAPQVLMGISKTFAVLN